MPRISQQERARVRARLLASAARHFAEHGLAGANINRISLDAGCAKGTVYNYFASKEELFASVLSVGSDRTVERFAERAPTGGLRHELQVLAEEDVALVREHQEFMRVIVAEALSARAQTRASIDAGLEPLATLLETLFERGRARGEVRDDLSARTLASAFIAHMTVMYAHHWRSEGAWPTWEELPSLLVTLFLDGAGARVTP